MTLYLLTILILAGFGVVIHDAGRPRIEDARMTKRAANR